MPRHRPFRLHAAAVLAALALPATAAAPRESGAPRRPAPATVAGLAGVAHPRLGPMQYDPGRGAWVAAMGPQTAVLTLDPQLQGRLERFLAARRVPSGAVVLLEPRTGRVLAMAEHSRDPAERGIALRAVAPAASVFKIVTTSALLEQGVARDDETCFHGGRQRLAPGLLKDDPRRDRKCYSLEEALGHSANVVYAKLASRDLSGAALRAEAGRFLFNAAIPFAWPVEVSRAEIPDGGFALAETAAGFGPVRLSPLHGALIASMVANGGVLVPPRIVESVDGGAAPRGGKPQRLLDPRVADTLAGMLRSTVTEGTARKTFLAARSSRSPLHGVTVAGKTGSLADRAPFRDYSWFVGFAGRDDEPEVAVAAVVVNELVWHVKATQVAHEALAAFFEGERKLPRVRTASR